MCNHVQLLKCIQSTLTKIAVVSLGPPFDSCAAAQFCTTEWWSSVIGARDSQTERDTWHSGITDPNQANVLQML